MAAVLLALGVCILAATGAAAHGGEPSIVIVPGRVPVGGTGTLFGDGLDATSEVAIELVTAEGPLVVAQARTDEDGHLATEFLLPDHLGPRYYEVRVRVATRQVVTSSLEVEAAGISSDLGQPTWIAPAALGILLMATSAVVVLGPHGPGKRRKDVKEG